MLRVKIAAAHHFAGDDKNAHTHAKFLREKHPDAFGMMAGRRQNLLEALEELLQRPPVQSGKNEVIDKNYPGWGGLPTGLAVMPDADVVLRPYWRYPSLGSAVNVDVPVEGMLGSDTRARVVILGRGLAQIAPPRTGGIKSIELRDGHVTAVVRQGNRRHTFRMPSLLRPVVVGDLIIYRDDERVIAVDALTGQSDLDHGWKSQPLPMERKEKAPQNARIRAIQMMIQQRMGLLQGDQGRYNLTVGGERVYTLCRFSPMAAQNINPFGRKRNNKPQSSSSSLAALSLREQGKLE